MYYIYIASSEIYYSEELKVIKIGCTENPNSRLSSYLTSCPPSLEPSCDIKFLALYETKAKTKEDLFDYEDEVHCKFYSYRLMRKLPGDSEWFSFSSKVKDPISLIETFVSSRPWFHSSIHINDMNTICSLNRKEGGYLNKQYGRNINYIKDEDERSRALSSLQSQIIIDIKIFLENSNSEDCFKAGIIISPCGSGKTKMVLPFVETFKYVIICVPTDSLKSQWMRQIQRPIEYNKDNFCIVTTYASSHNLIPLLEYNPLLIFDEAHHMGGSIISYDDEIKEGSTRLFLMRAVELNIKRIFLTFTPRSVYGSKKDKLKSSRTILSMHDTQIFGNTIGKLRLRELINRGILPDYRVWILQPGISKETNEEILRSSTSINIIGQMLLNAWDSKEIIRGNEQYILHHLVVFTKDNLEAKQLEEWFSIKQISFNALKNTTILRVQGGDIDINTKIKSFKEATRSIIINCKVLGEGVDIPITNGVSITYPKQSKEEIVQMLFRGGRWDKNKSIFHVLLPILSNDDTSGFEEVLTSLAYYDKELWNQLIIKNSLSDSKGEKVGEDGEKGEKGEGEKGEIESIIVNTVEGKDYETLVKVFSNIRSRILGTASKSWKTIQKICIAKGIKTSKEYQSLRIQMTNFPEDPRPKGRSWFDFLNPNVKKIEEKKFTEFLLRNNIKSPRDYMNWKSRPESFPSKEELSDQYFNKNLEQLLLKFGQFTINNRVNERR